MELAAVINQYFKAYINKNGKNILPNHLKTLSAIRRCRTAKSGELYVKCPDCKHAEWRPMSCGNRHCPKCQNHIASECLNMTKT